MVYEFVKYLIFKKIGGIGGRPLVVVRHWAKKSQNMSHLGEKTPIFDKKELKKPLLTEICEKIDPLL